MNEIIYLKTDRLLHNVESSNNVKSLRMILASADPYIIRHLLHVTNIGYDHIGKQFIHVLYGSIASSNSDLYPISFTVAKTNILAYLKTHSKIVVSVEDDLYA